MERKTKVDAKEGELLITITRDFDLPVELLYKAYEDAEIVSQWMGTNVVKLENVKHGSYQFQTKDTKGNIVFQAHGSIHDVIPNKRIVRTFEMENAPFGVQLETLNFERITEDTCRLVMHSLYQSVELRDQLLQMPFAYGINMAHDRLQQIFKK